jgi:hypothetical protein
MLENLQERRYVRTDNWERDFTRNCVVMTVEFIIIIITITIIIIIVGVAVRYGP